MLRRLIIGGVLVAVLLSACAEKTSTQTSVAESYAVTPDKPANSAVLTPVAARPNAASTSTVEPSGAPVGCQTFTILPTPSSEQAARFPASLPGDWVKGPADAAVTLIEYGDFQCPSCAGAVPLLDGLLDTYPGQLRIIFRHFPLVGFPGTPIHDKAVISAQAAEAAGRQDKFWEMHDLLFTRQADWTTLSLADFETWVVEQVGDLGLDVEQFKADLNDPELVELANAAWEQGVANSLSGTPSLVINGRLMEIPLNSKNLDTLVRLALLEKRQYTTCPPITINTASQYVATIQTSKGSILLELFADRAPLAVNNFIFLANEGWYDNITFHRVIPGFMAQAGDPTGTGLGGPGYTFVNEIIPELTFDRAGLLAMANAGPDSNGSQFFITYGPAKHLNGDFTIFGQVISGMDVLGQLAERDPKQGINLPDGDLILSITIEEK